MAKHPAVKFYAPPLGAVWRRLRLGGKFPAQLTSFNRKPLYFGKSRVLAAEELTITEKKGRRNAAAEVVALTPTAAFLPLVL